MDIKVNFKFFVGDVVLLMKLADIFGRVGFTIALPATLWAINKLLFKSPAEIRSWRIRFDNKPKFYLAS